MTNRGSTFGEKLAGACAALLLLAMFVFSWYRATVATVGSSAPPETVGVNAWQALTFIDLLLLAAAVVAIAVPLLRALGGAGALADSPASVVLGAGVAAVLLVLFRLIFLPGEEGITVGARQVTEIGRGVGVYLGLLLALGMALGGYLSLRAQASDEEALTRTARTL